MKKLQAKLTVFDDNNPITIKTYSKDIGAPYEIMIEKEFWATCESRADVHNEIDDIIRLYNYKFFPSF